MSMLWGRGPHSDVTDTQKAELDDHEIGSVRIFAVEAHNLQIQSDLMYTAVTVHYRSQTHSSSSVRGISPVYETFDSIYQDVVPKFEQNFLIEVHQKKLYSSKLIGSAQVDIQGIFIQGKLSHGRGATATARLDLMSKGRTVGSISLAMSLLSKEEDDEHAQLAQLDRRGMPNVLTLTLLRTSFGVSLPGVDPVAIENGDSSIRGFVVARLRKHSVETSLQLLKVISADSWSKPMASETTDAQNELTNTMDNETTMKQHGKDEIDTSTPTLQWQWMEEFRFPCSNIGSEIQLEFYMIPRSIDDEISREESRGGEEETDPSASSSKETKKNRKRTQKYDIRRRNAATLVGLGSVRVDQLRKNAADTIELYSTNKTITYGAMQEIHRKNKKNSTQTDNQSFVATDDTTDGTKRTKEGSTNKNGTNNQTSNSNVKGGEIQSSKANESSATMKKMLGEMHVLSDHVYDPSPPKIAESITVSADAEAEMGEVDNMGDPTDGDSPMQDAMGVFQREHNDPSVDDKIKAAEITQMKDGDYNIIVHAIEARDLKPKAANGANDPVIHVEVNDQKQHSQVIKNRNNAVFDHTMFFSLNKMTREEIEGTTIKISVFDAGVIKRNALIGMYQFDASNIYYMDHHELHNKWIGLTDPTSDKDRGLQGFLKLSVIVLGEGEKRHTWEANEEEIDETINADDDDSKGGLASMLLLPPSVEINTHFLFLTIHRAWGLPAMDSRSLISKGGIDAFVQVNFAGNKPLRTKWHTVKGDKDLRVDWHQEMRLPFIMPSMTNKIEVSVWDYDRLHKNKRVGTVILDLREIMDHGKNGIGPTWYPIYGAPDGMKRGHAAKVMNEKPHLASNYRGRLLLSLRHDPDTDQQLPEKAIISKAQRLPLQASPPLRRMFLKALVIAGDDLPSLSLFRSKEYRICVECGGTMTSTRPIYLRYGGSAQWIEAIGMMIEIPAGHELPWDPKTLPDTFVYLCSGSTATDTNRICYARFNTFELIKTGFRGAKTQWVTLTADPVVNAVDSVADAGSVLLRLAIGDPSIVDQETGDWELELEEASNVSPYQLRLHVYQGRDLPAADSNGSIDPFIRASLCGEVRETQWIPVCRNPQWYSTLTFDVMLPPFRFAPQLKVQLWDRDMFGSREYISEARFSLWIGATAGPPAPSSNGIRSIDTASPGFDSSSPIAQNQSYDLTKDDPFQYSTDIELLDVSSMRPKLKDPQWFGLARRGVFGGHTQGELLLGMQLVRKSTQNEPVPNIPPSIVPTTEDWWVEIIALGLRDLANFRFLPPNNPRVEFDVGKRNRATDCKFTQHSKKPSAKNPNFCERILLPVKVSLNPLFAPSLCITARDARLGGLLQPILGTASVHLDTKIPWSPTFDSKLAMRQQEKLMAASYGLQQLATTDWDDRDSVSIMSDESEPLIASSNQNPHMASQNSLDSIATNTKDNGAGIGLEKDGNNVTGADETDPAEYGDDVRIRDTLSVVTGASGTSSFDPRRNLIKWDGSEGEDDEDVIAYMKNRPIYGAELEETFGSSCFDAFALWRGQDYGRWFTTKSSLREVGIFKGMVRLVKSSDEACPLDLRTLLSPKPFIVRAYILNARNLRPTDSRGKSDPYIRIQLGDKKVSDKSRRVEQELDPEFCHMYEFPTILPGASRLKLDIYDYNMITRDELIGSTHIDLEDRWFDERWKLLGEDQEILQNDPTKRRLRPKPVETRALWHPTSRISQGSVRIWIDILPARDAAYFLPVNIERPPPAKYEVRLIIWRTTDVIAGDEFTSMNDLYVRAMLEGAKSSEHKTDTHWRAKAGKASFNWRMKWQITLPTKFPYLTLQMWDRDIFKYNDCLAEAQLYLGSHYRKAIKQKNRYIATYKSTNKTSGATATHMSGENPTDSPDGDPTTNTARTLLLLKDDDSYTSDSDAEIDVERGLHTSRLHRPRTEAEKQKLLDRAREKQKQEDARDTIRNFRKLAGIEPEIDPENSEWLTMYTMDNKKKKKIKAGNVLMSLEVLPVELAKSQFNNGSGRSEPNVYPYLPPPSGRMRFSLNPFYLLKELLGPKIYARLCILFALISLGLTIAYLGPAVSSIISFAAALPGIGGPILIALIVGCLCIPPCFIYWRWRLRRWKSRFREKLNATPDDRPDMNLVNYKMHRCCWRCGLCLLCGGCRTRN